MKQSVEAVHRCQLEMAIQVKKICEKHNIKFFLDAGTLLGAVREKGFIPWDDDIDIGFERDDYNRFIAVAEKELPENMFLQRWDYESAYGYPYAKIRYLGTKYRLKTDGHSKATDGVFLDLLPYDSVPNNKLSLYLHSLKLRCCYLLIQYRLGYNPEVKNRFTVPVLKLIAKAVQADRLKSKYEKTVIMYNAGYNCLNVTEADGIDYHRFIIPRTIVQSVAVLPFENVNFPVPKNYDKYLTLVYGDYMKRPKRQDQIGKHGVTTDSD